mmetsp:Transcript_10509/g.43522  ORF Transcript_10509/g.43522 Transcript_10509/m.43522 type:complete len:277 (-) Transcript_10509:180-1010(-)
MPDAMSVNASPKNTIQKPSTHSGMSVCASVLVLAMSHVTWCPALDLPRAAPVIPRSSGPSGAPSASTSASTSASMSASTSASTSAAAPSNVDTTASRAASGADPHTVNNATGPLRPHWFASVWNPAAVTRASPCSFTIRARSSSLARSSPTPRVPMASACARAARSASGEKLNAPRETSSAGTGSASAGTGSGSSQGSGDGADVSDVSDVSAVASVLFVSTAILCSVSSGRETRSASSSFSGWVESRGSSCCGSSCRGFCCGWFCCGWFCVWFRSS